MELIEIKDLEAGDEIIISCQSYFKYLKVLIKPTLGKKAHWNTGLPLYKSVKCSTRRNTVAKTYVSLGVTYTRYDKTWEITAEDHNFIQYIDLEYRQLLLVKKN